MKAFSIAILVTLLPCAAIATASGAGTYHSSDDGLLGGSTIARCQGKKCAGPGDVIRMVPGIRLDPRLSDNRGGRATAGSKKGSRKNVETMDRAGV